MLLIAHIQAGVFPWLIVTNMLIALNHGIMYYFRSCRLSYFRTMEKHRLFCCRRYMLFVSMVSYPWVTMPNFYIRCWPHIQFQLGDDPSYMHEQFGRVDFLYTVVDITQLYLVPIHQILTRCGEMMAHVWMNPLKFQDSNPKCTIYQIYGRYLFH